MRSSWRGYASECLESQEINDIVTCLETLRLHRACTGYCADPHNQATGHGQIPLGIDTGLSRREMCYRWDRKMFSWATEQDETWPREGWEMEAVKKGKYITTRGNNVVENTLCAHYGR